MKRIVNVSKRLLSGMRCIREEGTKGAYFTTWEVNGGGWHYCYSSKTRLNLSVLNETSWIELHWYFYSTEAESSPQKMQRERWQDQKHRVETLSLMFREWSLFWSFILMLWSTKVWRLIICTIIYTHCIFQHD